MRNLEEISSASHFFSHHVTHVGRGSLSVTHRRWRRNYEHHVLVSVRERTREIGLRQAVGAKTRDILMQFLVEATTLSICGGIVGVVVGIVSSIVISRVAGWQTVVGPSAVVLAVVFAALVGIGFGFYPALKAAYLDPIEALRFE